MVGLQIGILSLEQRNASAAFMDLGAGARAPGMGDAFTSLADDVYAVYYNPAGLAQIERPQLSAAYSALYVGLSDGSNLGLSQLTYANPLKRGQWGVLGGAYQQFALSGIYQENSIYLSWGKSFWKSENGSNFMAGLSAKYLTHSFNQLPESFNSMNGLIATGQPDPVLSGPTSKSAMDADLGFLYRFPRKYQLGMDVQHVNQPDVGFAGADKLPMNIHLGGTYRSLWMSIMEEIQMNSNPAGGQDKDFITAAERYFPTLEYGEFGVRGSVGFGSREWKQLTLGLSYRINKIQIDYAFLMPIGTIQDTAGTQRVALTFHFGAPTAEEEISKELLTQSAEMKAGKSPYLDAQRPHDLDDPKLEKVRQQVELGHYRMAHYILTQMASEDVLPDASFVRLSNRLGLVASYYPEMDLSNPAGKWEKVLTRSIHNFLYAHDRDAILQGSYALSLQPNDGRLSNFLSKMEEGVGIKAERMPVDSQRTLMDEMMYRVEAANNQGNREKVLSLLNDILIMDPESTTALERIGSTYYIMGKYKEAIGVWQRAVPLETNQKERDVLNYYISDAQNKLAIGAPPPELITPTAIPQEKPKAGAAPAVEKPAPAPARTEQPAAPKLRVGDPRDIPMLYQKGVEHYARGEYLQATAMFMRILQIDPSNVQAKKALERIQRINQTNPQQ